MKYLNYFKFFFHSIILFLIPYKSISQENNFYIEELGKNLFCSIQKQDTVSFKKLLISKDEITKEFHLKIKDQNKKERWIYIVENNWNEEFEIFIQKSIFSFENILLEGQKNNIDFKNINFEKFIFTRRNKDPDITYYSAELYFRYKNLNYYITIKDIIMLSNKFYIAEMKETITKID